MSKWIITAIILVGICVSPSFGQNKIVVTDWQELTFDSNYGNPITILWTLERSHKTASHMDDQYHFYLRFRSKTKFKGEPQSVYVGFDIEVEGREYNLQFGKTLYWDKHSSWDFWHKSTNPPIDIKTSGWVGTYLNEIEAQYYDPECAKVVEELGVYTSSEIVSDSKKAADKVSGLFDEDIAEFIAKYSKSSAKLFKFASKKIFGVIVDLIDPTSLSTPLDAYESAFEDARGHVMILEQHMEQLGQMNAPQQSNDFDDGDFWNTPENTATTRPLDDEERRELILSIQYSQKKLKEAMQSMEIALAGIKTELIIEPDDCKMTVLNEFHASFKYNVDVLLSISAE